MTQSRLVLLDTNVVLQLFELGVWLQVTQKYRIKLAQTVIDESQYFMRDGQQELIDWPAITKSGQIEVCSLSPADVQKYCSGFDPNYFEKLDPGEAESLALLQGDSAALISSADKIVWRVLGNTGKSDQGISLEELLHKCGLTKSMAPRYSRAFREQWTKTGEKERFMGLGSR